MEKLCQGLPTPKELTEEDIADLRRKAQEWHESFQKKARDVKNLTAEDLAMRAR